ncbi:MULTISPECIES: HAMP domain-containing sensor histidine kinase [Holzapfeliella]
MIQLLSQTKPKKKNREKQTEKKHFHISVAFKWTALMAMTITIMFAIFSLVITHLVKEQLMVQERQAVEETTKNFEDRLSTIKSDLTIATVVPALSTKKEQPNDQYSVQAAPDLDHSGLSEAIYNNLTNKDISVTVYNLSLEKLFQTRATNYLLSRETLSFGEKFVESSKGQTMYLIKAIKSTNGHNITGYVVVENKMTNYNNILNGLRFWMFILSAVGIILGILVSYLLISGLLRPVRQISKVAREVDEHPDETVRIPDLHRHDELGDMASAFNQMLDRMQRYIDQQKQFVEDVSHELRTPVAVIEGHLKLIDRWGKDDPEVLAESIDASIQEISRMKHLIQEMLDLTRAEQIEVLFPNEITKVSQVVQQVVDNLQMIHPDFKIVLDNDVSAKTEVKIYRNHFEQILIILLDNAIKYSKTRQEVHLSASTDTRNVSVIVQDFGEGITPEDREKIFNRFYRVDKARTREKGGNGLGLSIAQKLVGEYGGQISVESEPNVGSQFRVDFPIYRPEKTKSRNNKQNKKD